jgi:hypothetical protein
MNKDRASTQIYRRIGSKNAIIYNLLAIGLKKGYFPGNQFNPVLKTGMVSF